MADPQQQLPANIHVSTHPCLRAKMSQLRSQSTSARETKQLIHDISLMIGCEALAASLSTKESQTQVSLLPSPPTPSPHPLTPPVPQETSHLSYPYTPDVLTQTNISIVPILRSGLSMVDALQTLLPEPVPVFHLGMYRERSTLQPVEYYNNLPYHSAASDRSPSQGPSEIAILVDPIIASGETASAAIDSLRSWGVGKIVVCCVLATVDGLQRAGEAWSEDGKVEFWIGAVDPGLDDNGMIRPGVGDVGDRLFGTVGK